MKRRNTFDYIFPAIITAALYLSVLLWLKLDNTLPHWDMGRHLWLTILYRDHWQLIPHNFLYLGWVLLSYNYYPPLIHNVGLLFESIFGYSADAAVASNIIWISMLSFSVYFLARKLFNRWVAVASLFFVLASPMLIGQFREFQTDLPLTAMVALALLLLLKIENLQNKKYSILFGVVVGLAMLIKWTFLVFIIPPAVLIFFSSIRNDLPRRVLIKNLIYIIFTALLICGAWYFRNYQYLQADFAQNGIQQAAIEGDPVGWNKSAFLWYLPLISSNYLLMPLSVIAIAGMVYALVKKRWFVLFPLISYYIILSVLPNKDIRYIMPAIILIGLSGASLVELSSSKIYKTIFISILALICLTNNVIVAFGRYLPFRTEKIFIKYSSYGIFIGAQGYTSNSPKDQVCPMEDVVAFLPSDQSARLIGQDKVDFTEWAVGYFLTKDKKVWAGEANGVPDSEVRYLIHRNTDPLSVPLNQISPKLQAVKTFNCNDGSVVEIYKNN